MTSKDDDLVEKTARDLYCEFGGQKLTPFDDLPWKERKSWLNSAEIILDAVRPSIEREALMKAADKCEQQVAIIGAMPGSSIHSSIMCAVCAILSLIPRDEDKS